MKPLTKYFLKAEGPSANASNNKCLEDGLFKRSKTLPSKDIDNKRYLYSKVKEEEMAEEERILHWLASCDDESEDNEKLDKSKDKCNEEIRSHPRETMCNKSDEMKNNQIKFADKIVEAEKQRTATEDGRERKREREDKESSRANDVNSFKSINQNFRMDLDISKTMKPEIVEISDGESVKILKDCSPELCKEKKSLSRKKSGQRKISDFFQRVS